MAKGVVIFFLALTLVACMPWPRHGHGGAAEMAATPFIPFYPSAPDVTPRQLLQTRLLVARNQLDNLQTKGAKACFPGLVHLATLQSNRTVREFSGGLYDDASTDLMVLEGQVNMLNRYMNSVYNRVTCRPGNQKYYSLFQDRLMK